VAGPRLFCGGILDLRKLVFLIGFLFLLIILGFVGWFIAFMFEGETPSASLQPLPQYISKAQKFTVGRDKTRAQSGQSSITQEAKRWCSG
jgi:hypothetical protein